MNHSKITHSTSELLCFPTMKSLIFCALRFFRSPPPSASIPRLLAQSVLTDVLCLHLQLLLSAKSQLEAVVGQRLEEAVSARDHTAVLRFVRLHKLLAAPDKGISRCAV